MHKLYMVLLRHLHGVLEMFLSIKKKNVNIIICSYTTETNYHFTFYELGENAINLYQLYTLDLGQMDGCRLNIWLPK